jgi:hypothetical protein
METTVKFAPTTRSIGGAVAAVALLVLSGCDMQGIPLHATTDAGPSEEADAGADTALLCEPGQRSCVGPAVGICNGDGSDFAALIECEASSTCENGQCQQVPTQCDGPADGNQPFSVRPRHLAFASGDDLKSTTQRLDITNCTNSMLTIREASIRAPLIRDPNESVNPGLLGDVFLLDNSHEIQDQEIPPGATQSVRVRYRPKNDFSREEGRLRLEILGATYKQFYIPLRPKDFCVTATPEVDVGQVSSTAARRVYLQNCGTEPLALQGIHAEPNKPEAASTAEVSVAFDDELPVVEPGETFEATFELRRLDDGDIDQRIVFELADPESFGRSNVVTQITGQTVPDTCREQTLDRPRVWIDPSQEMRTWQAAAKTAETVHFELAAPQGAGQLSIGLRTPFGSRTQLESQSEGDVTPGKHSFRPDVAGTYYVDVAHFDADGTPLCDAPSLQVEVEPTAELYVDLQWITHGDFILDDVCHGCGVDLNLHVIATDDFERTAGGWLDDTRGCYGLGELPAGDERADVRAPIVAGCQSAGGSVESLSISGATREVITVEETEARYFLIGVHAWSMYDFGRATAKLSVYGRGERVEEVVIDPRWWEHSAPDNLDELLVNHFDRARSWWVYGLWDAQTNTLFPVPTPADDGP